MEKLILGLDPSLNNYGWAFINIECDYKSSGVIKPGSKLNHFEKLVYIKDNLDILKKQYKPDFVSLEIPFYNKLNPKSFFIQGKISGISEITFYDCNLELFSAMEIKSTLDIVKYKGGDTKKLIRDKVIALFNLQNHKFKSYDESDAISIAYTYLKRRLSDEQFKL